MKRVCTWQAFEDVQGRPFTGAWIETTTIAPYFSQDNGRPFTGAWIETYSTRNEAPLKRVAPSRGRGLKLYFCPRLR